jgi:hypothetical protein
MAIAMSPVPEVAVALPSWNNVIPSTETATFGSSGNDGSAAVPTVAVADPVAASSKMAPPGSGGEDGSAAAVPGLAATATPMPSPTASRPPAPVPSIRVIR